MQDKQDHLAIEADEVPLREIVSSYPEPFASQMAGRSKRQLGEFFGLTNFGVNLTSLAPNAVSALRHAHSKQDEFLYVLQGHPTLHTDQGPIALAPGMCSGMKAGTGQAFSLSNDTKDAIVYLEIGDRTPGDEVTYPDDDLQAIRVDDQWQFLHKDGSPY